MFWKRRIKNCLIFQVTERKGKGAGELNQWVVGKQTEVTAEVLGCRVQVRLVVIGFMLPDPQWCGADREIVYPYPFGCFVAFLNDQCHSSLFLSTPALSVFPTHSPQFLRDVDWGELDYLVIDTPPGTSDEHISMAQYLKESPVEGAIVITTPQVERGSKYWWLGG